jgi:undecaprenyl-diphosphatase
MDIIEAIKYLLLGIIQGITEVLPVSSSGHVEIAKTLFEMEIDEGLLFLILVNTGSLIAFIFVFFRDLVNICEDVISYMFRPSMREDSKDGFLTFIKLVIASIPAGILGILLNDKIDELMMTYNVLLSGVGLLLTATILLITSQGKIKKGYTHISYVDAVLIGLAQGAALVPGISRSGSTASTALRRGIGIDSALRFSFLMYIPISVGSMILYIFKISDEGFELPSSEYLIYYALSFLGAMVSTYLAFKFIFNIFKSGKLKYFSYYCFVIGILSIILYIIKL